VTPVARARIVSATSTSNVTTPGGAKREGGGEERRPGFGGSSPLPSQGHAASPGCRLDRRLARAASRPAMTMPACQPGARPRGGSWILAASIPAWARSHEMIEFEFHISPVWRSSRPQIRAGREGTRSRIRDARARSSVTRMGLKTASSISGMTPSRHRRTSYRNSRKCPASLVPTGPSKTTPRRSPCRSGTGVCSMVKRPSGTTTTRAEWYRSHGRRRWRRAPIASKSFPLSLTTCCPAPNGIQ